MKKFSVFLLVAASLSLFGCHRNYKVNYARVPVDSTINHNIDSVDEIDNYDAEPLFQDAQFEGDVEDMDQARREYRKYINGTGN